MTAKSIEIFSSISKTHRQMPSDPLIRYFNFLLLNEEDRTEEAKISLAP